MIRSLKATNTPGQKRSAYFLIYMFWVVLLGLGIFTSCTKSPNQLGAKILPDSALNVFYTDTSFVRVYSSPLDSVRSDKSGAFFLGSIKDPVFGITNAGFYTQMEQLFTHKNFGTNPQLDSLVMQMLYTGVYGDTNSVLRLHVYELQKDIFFDSTYYSNHTVPVYPTDYADYTFTPRANNTVIIGSDTIKNVLRFSLSNLSKALGNQLLHADSTVLDSNAYFVKYFKGLYFKTNVVTSGGAIASFAPSTASTVLTLYYHNDSTDSLKSYYVINGSMAMFNQYEHDFHQGNPDFVNQVVNKDTLLGQVKYYVQGLGGLQTIIKFPNIKKFARLGHIAINEAKLVLPGFEPQPYWGAPSSLSLLKITSDTSYSVLIDQLGGGAYFGGSYKASTNSYVFRITHYIQSLIKDTTQQNRGLLLYIKNGAATPQRFIFNGPQQKIDTLARTKLELIYTKLP